MTVLIVTGTTTGVGKTITTAMLAAQASRQGIPVAACKPIQTGNDDDLAVIANLSGIKTLINLAHYQYGLAPLAAARHSGTSLPQGKDILNTIENIDHPGQLTLVEGAGGLLVQLGADGTTLRDIAAHFHAPVLIVTNPHLGTLNSTTLTLEALSHHNIVCAGIVLGSWPAVPNLVEITNYDALTQLAPLRAALPAGIGSWEPSQFAQFSDTAFCRQWINSLITLTP